MHFYLICTKDTVHRLHRMIFINLNQTQRFFSSCLHCKHQQFIYVSFIFHFKLWRLHNFKYFSIVHQSVMCLRDLGRRRHINLLLRRVLTFIYPPRWTRSNQTCPDFLKWKSQTKIFHLCHSNNLYLYINIAFLLFK